MATGVVTWSTTAASNATADSNVNWAEGQAPSSVNDSARAMMSSVAKFRDDTNGSITTGGTSTAFTVTSNQSFASLTAMGNAVIAFVPHTTSGAAPTLAVDGLTAKAVRFPTAVDLPSGVLIQGTPYVVTYFASVGEFIIHNIGGDPWAVPLGVAMPFFGTAAPNSSFVLPYAQAISRTTYSTLFTMFSTTYGSGDGSTTFNIPDLRNRLPIGKGDMGGSSSGRITSTHFGGGDPNGLGATGGDDGTAIAQGNLPSVNLTGTPNTATFTHNAGIAPVSGSSSVGVGAGGTGVYPASSFGAIPDHTLPTYTVPLGGSGTEISRIPPGIICNYLMRVI